MHEDILSWPGIDVFYTSSTEVTVDVEPYVYCTRVYAQIHHVAAIADHYGWNVIGLVIV